MGGYENEYIRITYVLLRKNQELKLFNLKLYLLIYIFPGTLPHSKKDRSQVTASVTKSVFQSAHVSHGLKCLIFSEHYLFLALIFFFFFAKRILKKQ